VLSLIFFNSPGKKWLDSKLAKRARKRGSVSGYNALAERHSSACTGKGVHMIPPVPSSVKELKS
jgi:hypothetical protein